MKKSFLFAAGIALSISASAQRLSLYEEFSGENCGPCAVANPGLWALVTKPGNESKILLIKYQSPIPTAGPIYNQYTTVTDARMDYYAVNFAPYGRLNGALQGSGSTAGSVGLLTQADIDAEATAPTSFNMTVTAVDYNFKGDTVSTTVKIDCTAPYTGALKLRVGMIEHLVYATAPGTNGEKEFHNVVREMYPNADGTTMPGTWTVGMSQTFVIKGRVRAFVKKPSAPKMVAWLQQDVDKKVLQTALSTALPSAPYTDNITSSVISVPSTFNCTGKTITGATIKLTNTGTATATSATIYYRVGTGAWSSQPWTGSLATGASTTVTLGTITLPSATGIYALTDSVDFPGERDILDNVFSTTYTVAANTATTPLDYSTNLETGMPAGFTIYTPTSSNGFWILATVNPSTSTVAKSGVGTFYMPLYAFASGSTSTIIVPTPVMKGKTSLEFWQAYAQISSGNTDKLEVVYSNDCGNSWTSIWNMSGSSLATAAPENTMVWFPDRTVSTEWVKRAVDITAVPSTAILGIKVTDGGGNTIWIDDIAMRTIPTSIKEEVLLSSFSVSPNPANDFTNISFNLAESTNVKVTVVDAVGKTVVTAGDAVMTSGAHEMRINTSSLSTGMYMIRIATASGITTEKLSVVK